MARSLEGPGAVLLSWWRRLSPLPSGRTLFSMMVGRMAPYTGTMGARAEALEPGYARWTLRDRRHVRNHLRSIHAIALANLIEVTSGTAMLSGLPPGARGIIRRLDISYEKKARGLLTAECRCPIPEFTGSIDVEVRAEVRDRSGDVVARGVATWRLSRETPAA